jgi:hypothetical protein
MAGFKHAQIVHVPPSELHPCPLMGHQGIPLYTFSHIHSALYFLLGYSVKSINEINGMGFKV